MRTAVVYLSLLLLLTGCVTHSTGGPTTPASPSIQMAVVGQNRSSAEPGEVVKVAESPVEAELQFGTPIQPDRVKLRVEGKGWKLLPLDSSVDSIYRFRLLFGRDADPRIALWLDAAHGKDGRSLLSSSLVFYVEGPQLQTSAEANPADQDTPTTVPGTAPSASHGVPTPQVPPIQPGFNLWVFSPADGQTKRILHLPEALLLHGSSPDGRYLLLEKLPEQWGGTSIPFLYDRVADQMRQAQPLEVNGNAVAWSGTGFWVNWLVHLDLDLKLNRYEPLRAKLGLSKERYLLTASFSGDGRRVAALVMNEALANETTLSSDLIISNADGSGLQVIEHAVQPWFGKSGYGAELALSPDGERLLLRSASPGTALIETQNPAKANWKSLVGTFVQPGLQYLTPSLGRPAVWSPDSGRLWYPNDRLFNRAGQMVTHLPEFYLWVRWRPDGTALLLASRGQEAKLLLPEGQVQSLGFELDDEPFALLPDGRLLFARTVSAK